MAHFTQDYRYQTGILLVALGIGLIACEPAVTTLTTPQHTTSLGTSPLTSSPLALTAPPRGLTAPPRGFTTPPKGFTALTGKITLPAQLTLVAQSRWQAFSLASFFMPPALALPATLLDQIRLNINGETISGLILQDKVSKPDGSLEAHYYVPPISYQEKMEAQLMVAGGNATLLMAAISAQDNSVALQDLNLETTALSLMQKAAPQLSVFELAESPQFQAIKQQVQAALSSGVTVNIATDPALQQFVQKSIGELIPKNLKVTSIQLTPAPLTLASDKTQPLTIAVKMSNGSLNRRVNWISRQPDIALIDSDQTVVAFQPGQALLEARAVADATKMAELKITVTGTK